MASRISQMRNGLQPYPQTQEHLQQQQLNESIEQVRGFMQNLSNLPNPQEVLLNALQNNPQTAQLVQLYKSNSLEQFAKMLAQARGANINDVINQLLKR